MIKKIKEQRNDIVFVAIAKINEWETFDEWKTRSFKNLKNDLFSSNATTETNKICDTFFIDISIVEYFNLHCDMNDRDEKQQQSQAHMINKMHKKKEFELK